MEKIKLSVINWIESGKGKNVLLVIIIVLVGLSSFELGRLSKAESSSGIKIEYPAELQNQSASATEAIESISDTTKKTKSTKPAAEMFFASNRGHKYYPLGCSAGKTIKQENRVYFATRAEAEKAGYELSSSCR